MSLRYYKKGQPPNLRYPRRRYPNIAPDIRNAGTHQSGLRALLLQLSYACKSRLSGGAGWNLDWCFLQTSL